MNQNDESQRMIALDLNENTEVDLEEAIRNVSTSDIRRYPDYHQLIDALSEYAGVPCKNILLTNGADQGIRIVLREFCRKKKLLLPVPLFDEYQHVCNAENISVKPLHVFPAITPSKIVDAISADVDGVVICNPQNPLSTAIDPEELLPVIQEAEKRNCFVFVDEAYYEFFGKTCLGYAKKFSNVLIIRSFSKAFGIAGLRLGYVISCSENIKRLSALQSPWDVNGVGVRIGQYLLKSDSYAKAINTIISNREHIASCIRSEGFIVLDSKTNFLTFQVRDASKFVKDMSHKCVRVRNLSEYSDGSLKNFIRMAVPSSQELETVLNALYDSLRKQALT